MKKRGQAATEFLTTYGWAILILLAIVIIVFNLNLFTPKAPNTCESVSPIFCSDVKLSGSTINLILSSSGTSAQALPELRPVVNQVNLQSPNVYNCVPTSPNNIIIPDQKTTITCIFPQSFTQGNRFSGTVKITYYLAETESLSLPHTIKLSFSGTIE